jgi:Na+/H+-dicarboxylate symporter
MSLTARILVGLVLGLVSGIVISLSSSDTLNSIPPLVEPVGALWVNAIRMIVVPLIVSLLITAIAGDKESGSVANLGAKTVGLFALMVGAICVYTALAAPPLLALLTLDPAIVESLRAPSATVDSTSVVLPPFRDWLVDLIPTNPLKAAVDSAMLPLIVFVALFASAMARIADTGRDILLRFFTAIKNVMFVLIGWIMAVAPVGVFALMLTMAATMGIAAAGAIGYFLLITFGLIVLAGAVLYVLAVVLGRMPLASFARACAPAQVVGFSTRSSLASLPAMFTAAEDLKFSPAVTGLVLPVAVSIFKFASPIARASGAFFIARLYGIELGPTEIIAIAGAIGLLSFYSPGIPSGGLLIMAPLYISMNLPVEGIGILIALDQIVDMFITPANVTANLTVVSMLTRSERKSRDDDPNNR